MRFMSVFMALLSTGMLFGQPLSGHYTVGGSTPDFASPQDAASALFARGVSGPVFINIRPGIYMRNGGNNTVLRLDSLIAGVSATNRVTFQSDAGAGGNVDNVILQFNRTDPATADRDLVRIRLDFVTLRNLTLQDIDSTHISNNSLIHLEQLSGQNPTVDGFILEGCRLIGTSFIQSGSTFLGTDFGIRSNQNVRELTVRGNTFRRLLRAVSVLNSTNVAQTTITIEDNTIIEGYWSATGAGGRLGAGVEIACTTAIVRRNVIDFTNSVRGGFRGLYVGGPKRALVERNSIAGHSEIGMEIEDFFNTAADSVLIANNMVVGGSILAFTGAPTSPSALRAESRNTRIVFNTVVVPGGSTNASGLVVFGSNCTVLNNIILNYSSGGSPVSVTAYNMGSSTQAVNILTDYNVIFKLPNVNGALVRHKGISYSNIIAYQDSTGLDTNSVSQEIDFINFSSDLHLTDCQAQDLDLRGTPVEGLENDFDGDIRSTTVPMRGADEVALRAIPMWGETFRTFIPGIVTDIAAGKFDNLLVDGLAVADWENSQVRLYHNLPSSRSFELSQILFPGFKPMNVKFFDLDDDGNLDVVVSGDTSLIRVYWGDGGGGFPSDTTIEVRLFSRHTPLPVVSLDTGRAWAFGGSLIHTILVSCGLRTAPVTNFLGYLDNAGGRGSIRFLVTQRPASVPTPDSISGILRDFVGADIDGNGDPEVAAVLAAGVVTDFLTFNDTDAHGGGGFLPFGTHYDYSVGATSYMPTSSVVAGNFDGDGDLDFVTTAASTDQVILLRNQGSFNFSPETIPVNSARGLATLDYDNDGDLDFVTVNLRLEDNGVTVFLNDGFGNFGPEFNCFQWLGSGQPLGVVASDFDLDGRTDLAIASGSGPGRDTVFVLYNLGGGITGADEKPMLQDLKAFRLEQNYPNPFNSSTEVWFLVGGYGFVSLKVYDVLGREVATLVNEELPPGEYTRTWHGSDMASGMYFYRLKAGSFVETRKLILLK